MKFGNSASRTPGAVVLTVEGMKLRQANDNGQAVAKAHHDLSELPSRMACEPQLPQNKNVL